MLRRDQLCPGPGECSYVLMEDPYANAMTPPCEECPASKLDQYLASGRGQWIQAAVTLDFALQAGVSVSLREISYSEFQLLRLLTEERNRWQEETMKKQQPPTRPGRLGYGR